MNLAEFINKYDKTKVDYDKMYGAQCVDLFRQYCNDVLLIGHTGGVEGAKDLWEKYDDLPKEKLYFEKVKNVVQVGDVAIWGATSTNKYGHVGIVVGNMPGKDLLIFEQDGFKQDGAKFKVRSIDNLLGYLRFKG